MTMSRKLDWGLGFLFAIIFGLVFFSAYYVQTIAADTENILKDNYASVVYAKEMASAFHTMDAQVLSKTLGHSYEPATFARARDRFEKNLSREQRNLTEAHEAEYVQQLGRDYARFLSIAGEVAPDGAGRSAHAAQIAPIADQILRSTDGIFEVNMRAILRKNDLAKHSATRTSWSMQALSLFLLLVALGYFWYFPFYVSTSLSHLSTQMRQLVADAGAVSTSRSDDELFVMLDSIRLLRSRWNLTKPRQ